MKFGQRKAEATSLDSSNEGNYLRNFKDGEVTVRFIEECDDWIVFREHYLNKKSFPCTEDDSCPGCNSDDDDVRRASRKYATNIMLVSNKAVLPFRIPITLAKRAFSRAERNDGTITNRDYVVMKSGKGLDTEYDIEAEDKYTLDLDSLRKEAKDLQEILRIAYEENAPATDKVAAVKKKEEPEAEEKFPSKPEPQSASASDSGDIEIDEDALYEMTLEQLVELANTAGITIEDGSKKSAVIRTLIQASE